VNTSFCGSQFVFSRCVHIRMYYRRSPGCRGIRHLAGRTRRLGAPDGAAGDAQGLKPGVEAFLGEIGLQALRRGHRLPTRTLLALPTFRPGDQSLGSTRLCGRHRGVTGVSAAFWAGRQRAVSEFPMLIPLASKIESVLGLPIGSICRI